MNKQSWTADKGQSSRLDIGQGLLTIPSQKASMLQSVTQGLSDGMYRANGTHGKRQEKHTTFLPESLNARDHFGDLIVDDKIILKCILKK